MGNGADISFIYDKLSSNQSINVLAYNTPHLYEICVSDLIIEAGGCNLSPINHFLPKEQFDMIHIILVAGSINLCNISILGSSSTSAYISKVGYKWLTTIGRYKLNWK